LRRIDRKRTRVFGRALPQIVIDGDAIVEHETFAFPKTRFGGRFFEVFQNSAFELKDFPKAHLDEQRREFFAPDPARAEHRDPAVLGRIEVFGDECRQIT
jgi:hypothetical protein